MRYWPSVTVNWIWAKIIFLMDRDEVAFHQKATKEQNQYSAILTEQA